MKTLILMTTASSIRGILAANACYNNCALAFLTSKLFVIHEHYDNKLRKFYAVWADDKRS
jgi:hypothetical protein